MNRDACPVRGMLSDGRRAVWAAAGATADQLARSLSRFGGLERLEDRVLLSAAGNDPLAAPMGPRPAEISVAETDPYSLLNYVSSIRRIGDYIEQRVSDAIGSIAGGDIPFIDQTLADIASIGEVFDELALRLLDPITITATANPSGYTLASDAAFRVSLDGGAPIAINVTAASTAGNSTAADIAADINTAIAAAGLSASLVAGVDGGGNLTIATANSGVAASMALTTVNLQAGAVGPTYGQLGSNVSFTFDITTETLDGETGLPVITTSPATVTLDSADTTDNTMMSDLADDLNGALLEAFASSSLSELLHIYAQVDATGNKIVFVTDDPEITTLSVTNVSNLSLLGFTSGQSAQESDNAITSSFKLEGARLLAMPKFTSMADLMPLIETELQNVSDRPLPLGFDIDWVYDSGSETLEFNLALNQDYTQTVPLDFTEGLDLGPLGTLEFTAKAEGTLSAVIDLNFRAGIYLGALGADFLLTNSTPLSTLNAGLGVPLNVGITATNYAPSNGKVAANSTINLSINGAAAVPITVTPAATADNFDQFGLADDINAALIAAGLDSQVEAVIKTEKAGNVILGRKIMLVGRTTDVRSLGTTGGSAMGFGATQSGDRPDLSIVVGPNTYLVNLDGATTIQHIITAIQTQTAGEVAVTINADNGLTLTSTTPGVSLTVVAAEAEGIRSGAGYALGITGYSADGVIVGPSLHGETLADRLYIVEPAAGESNLSVGLTLEASGIDLRAALGLVEIAVTDAQPIVIDLQLPLVRLTDPGTDAADGRITFDELANSDAADVIDIPAAQGEFILNVEGSLELSDSILSELAGGALVTMSITTADPTDISTIEFNADTSGFEDALDQLGDLSIEQIITLVRSFIEQVSDENSFPLLNQEIPLLQKSLNDIISLADNFLDTLDSVLSSVDTSALNALRSTVQSAISNLADAPANKQEMIDAIDGIGEALASDPSRLPSRLLSAAGELRKAVEAYLGEGLSPAALDPLEQELKDAVESLLSMVPSMDSLADRLEAAVNEHMPAGTQFTFAIVDYDANTAGNQNAIVLGFEASASINEAFTPEIPTVEFGPIEIGATPSFTLYAGASFSIGLGINLSAGSPELFLIVDPPSNPDLVKTELSFSAGFNGTFSGGVNFGALEAAQADVRLSLLNAAKEDDLAVLAGGVVNLANTPYNGDERYVIVSLNDGTVLDLDNFTLSGSVLTITTGGSLLTLPTVVDVKYPVTVTGDPANAADRAALTFNFDDPAYTITGNTIGAVPFSALFGGGGPGLQTNVDGMITGSLSVEVLNSVAEDAITLAVDLEHPLDPQLMVDSDALEEMLANIDFDLCTIAEGADALLQLIETGLTSEVLSQLPIVGGGLNTAGTFIGKMRSQFVVPFKDFVCDVGGTFEEVADTVRRFVFEKLGPGLPSEGIPAGLAILGDRSGDGLINLADVDVELDQDHFEVVVKLAGRDEMTADFDFGLGGMVLGAEGQGGVTLGMGYDVDFGLGLSRTQGLYLVLNDGSTPTTPASKDEFQLDLTVGLAVDDSGDDPIPTSLELNLFGLTFSATDILTPMGETGTKLSGILGLDINDPDPGDGLPRLAIADFGDVPFGELFEVSLGAIAEVNIRLEAKITDDLPSIQADLVADWSFSLASVDGSVGISTDFPNVALENIGLNLGDFLSRYVGPVVEDVNEFIDPLRPAIEFLSMEVPGVSQISDFIGQGKVYMIDLAFLTNPEAGKSARTFLGVLQTIIEVIDMVGTIGGGDDVIIDFGDFVLSSGGVDLRNPGWNTGGAIDTVISNTAAGVVPAANQVIGAANEAIGSFFQTVSREPDNEGLGGLGIELSFLKPENIFKYLIGQTADVITWNIPRLDFEFEWEQTFNVFPVPPISLTVGLGVSGFADLSVGFDTRGLLTGNFLNGFYFGDRENVSTGKDIDEFGFGIGAWLGASLDILIASVGVEGELRADLFANWRDVDNDGKMYLDEIAEIVETDGLDCLFDLTGQLRAIVRLVWEVFGSEGSHEFINAVLLEWKNECPHYAVAHVSDGSDSLPGGFTATNGMLIIHSGAFAGEREPGKSTDTHESFTITEVAPGVYSVDGMGFVQRYAGVSSIFFDGGKGNDSVELVNVTVPTTLLGGDGADKLLGGGAADHIDGQDGSDTVQGFAGADSLVGGSGNDSINGDAGNDTIDAGAGDDLIDGGSENDSILAGAGNDKVEAGAGNDTVLGDAGRDTIYGRAGNDSLDGGSGDDFIYGDVGTDTILGGAGADRLEGEADADWIYAGNGNDLVLGGPGKDTLLGGWGNDAIVGHLVGDSGTTVGEHIEGGPDDDFICGTDGPDAIFGGTSDLGLSLILADEATAGSPDWGYTMVDCDTEPTYTEPVPVTITGQKFDDHNANGVRDADEEGINGWTIELYDENGTLIATALTADVDLDNNGSIDPMTERGVYVFSSQDPGTYTVRELEKDKWFQTYPVGGEHNVELDDGQTASGLNFGNYTLGEIHSTKWQDMDGDGVKDPDEPGLGGVLVYLDLTGNGTYDNEFDIATITAYDDPATAEDEAGTYSFVNLAPGIYNVREVVPAGHSQTFPRVVLNYFQNFSGAVGPEWSSGATAITPAGANPFLGQFGNQAVNLTLGDLKPHRIVTVSFDLYVIRSWDGNSTFNGPDRFTFGLHGEPQLLDTTFSNTGNYQDYPAPFGTANNAARTGAVANNTLGYLDGNSPSDAVYHFEFSFPHKANSLWLEFMGMGLESIKLDSWGLDNVQVVIGDDEHIVDLQEGEVATGIDFGNMPRPGGIVGQKFNDLDGNGVRDSRELGIAEWLIYLDLDEDGQRDENEPFTFTDGQGNYSFQQLPAGTYVVREANHPKWTQTAPKDGFHVVTVGAGNTIDGVNFGNQYTPGSITGRKFHDLNGDGMSQSTEPGIPEWPIYIDFNNNAIYDKGDLLTYTGGDGQYMFEDLPAGTHVVREILRDGWMMTTPQEGFHTVILQAGGDIGGIDFGNIQKPVDRVVPGTTAADVIHVRQVQGIIEVFVNIAPDQGQEAQFKYPAAETSSLTFDTGAGDDRLFVYCDGSVMPVPVIKYLAGGDDDGLIVLGGDEGGLFEAVDNVIRSGERFVEYDSLERFRFEGGFGDDTLIVHTPLPFTPEFVGGEADDTLDLRAGKYLFGWNLGDDTTRLHLHVRGTTLVGFGASQRLETLSVWDDTDIVHILNGKQVIETGALLFHGDNAHIDLGDNSMIVRRPPVLPGAFSGVFAALDRARNGSGRGIGSSAAGGAFGLAALYNEAGGEPVIASLKATGNEVAIEDLVISYTVVGDIDLDRIVTGNDFFLADRALLSGGTYGQRLGDIDFNGLQDGDDYFAMDNGFLGQSSLSKAGPASIAPAATIIGSVSGTKWNDLNGDCVRDPGEPGVAGFTIYADMNRNGQFDPGEPSAVTQADNPQTDIDETGQYVITGLINYGDTVIREVVPADWVQTFPSARLLSQTMTGQLYDLWPVDGTPSHLRPTATGLVGISQSPTTGALYGLSNSGWLYIIDIATGAATQVAHTQRDFPEGDIEFDPSGATIYGLNGTTLIKIDPTTAAVSNVGPISSPGIGLKDPSGMAFDATGNLWVLDPGVGALVKVNKNTGAILSTVTLSGNQFNLAQLAGIDFSPCDGRLYAVNGVSGSTVGTAKVLYTIDTATGAVSVVGPTDRDLAGLEFIADGGHYISIPQRGYVEGVDFGNRALIKLYDGADNICAEAGNDTVYGDNLVSDPNVISIGDSDSVCGGAGNDRIDGQDKDDELRGEEGKDTIRGGDGIDRVIQTVDADQTLTDTQLTGQGPDTLDSIERATLTGGAGNNKFDASGFTPGGVIILGLGGDDEITGSKQSDSLDGGEGNDKIFGLEGSDSMIGGAGSDTTDGGDGNDIYVFGAAAAPEADVLVESTLATGGFDWLDFRPIGAVDVTVDLTGVNIISHANRTATSAQFDYFEIIYGGAGNDTLIGNAVANLIVDGAGNDLLAGMGGDDQYFFDDAVGLENDQVDETRAGSSGSDWLNFALLDGSTPVSVNLAAGANGVIASHTGRQVTAVNTNAFENATGTTGNDSFTDNQASNRFVGGDGDDIYRFVNPTAVQTDTITEQNGGGIDLLDFAQSGVAVSLDLAINGNFGTNGGRTISGDALRLEHAIGGSAADTLRGNTSDNRLIGGPGGDLLQGREGNDTVIGGAGSDQLEGGDGDDTYVFAGISTAETDTVTESASASGGNDTLDFTALASTDPLTVNLTLAAFGSHINRNLTSPAVNLIENVLGGAGNDTITGNAGRNLLVGNDGNDSLEGGDGSDTVRGGMGNDGYVFNPATGLQVDSVEERPGQGTDALLFTGLGAATPVTVDLGDDLNIAVHALRVVRTTDPGLGVNFENVAGGAGNDTITGSDANNILVGLDGNDVINGGKGRDSMLGGNGSNTLSGGAGDDTYYFQETTTATDTLIEDSGLVDGGAASAGGADTLDFTFFTTGILFDLSALSSTVAGTTINLEDSTGPKADYFENIKGAPSGGNWLIGNVADNRLEGGSAGDVLAGQDGDDYLIGNGGGDWIVGGNGDDILIGGLGDDSLFGDAGRDILIGGVDADELEGGDEDDILINGTTSYDGDSGVLNAIRLEWKSTLRTYAERVSRIGSGVGVGNAYKFADGATVFDDGVADLLTGGLGTDWFFDEPLDTTTP